MSHPNPSDPPFANAAMAFLTPLGPHQLLSELHAIESLFDRARQVRWAPRSLDLDLIALGDLVLPDRAGFDHWRGLSPERQAQETPSELILPHPRMQDRAFVLAPLCEVAPDWRHPVLGRSVQQMRDALPAEAFVGLEPLR